jgi:tRNA pseudouridine65 synthase
LKLNADFWAKHPSPVQPVPPILWQDKHLVAINKPHGLLVHPSPLARNADTSAMEQLRDHLGRYVYPVHRLDRKTGGVLLFARTPEIQRVMMLQFEARIPRKTYLAIVRGHTPIEGTIDYPLRNDAGKLQDALTHYLTLVHSEIPVPLGKHATSRYSLLRLHPETGRMHQLRKHMAHILHPIIADRPHGCNKQNRHFKEKWNMDTMLLHAWHLEFRRPENDNILTLTAPLQEEFTRMLGVLGFAANQKIVPFIEGSLH